MDETGMTYRQKVRVRLASNIAYNLAQTANDENSRYEFGRIKDLLDRALAGEKDVLDYDILEEANK